jgi:hypothetical protein
MKSIIDQEMVKRKASFAQKASLGGLILMLGSAGISIWKPDQTTLSTILLFIGFAVAAIGIYNANRWVKKPRPEKTLEAAFKSVSDAHRLYHYLPFCDHLLLAPNCIVVLEAVNLEGTFTYKDGKWKQQMSMSRALRFIFEERLGDPVKRAQQIAKQIQELINKEIPEAADLPVLPWVVFVSPAAQLVANETPIPISTSAKIHKRLPTNLPRFSPEVYSKIQAYLDSKYAVVNE